MAGVAHKPKAQNILKVGRLILSGALLGVAAANGFFDVSPHGELLAGVIGAGGAAVAMKLTAIIQVVELLGYKLGADGITVIVALLCAGIRGCQDLYKKQRVSRSNLVSSALNGASIFPFILMFGGAFSESWLAIATSSKGTMAIAGLVGLIFVGGEVVKPADHRHLTQS